MASKLVTTTMASRIALLPRPTTSSALPSVISRAPSRSISNLTRHKSNLQSTRTLLPQFRTAQHHPSTRTNTNKHSSLRHQSTQPDPSTPEIKSYKFEDITSSKPTQILIDVREPPELVSTGIIPSALSIPLASHPDALFLTPDEFLTRFGFPKPGAPESAADAEAEAEASPTQRGSGENAEEEPKIVFYCKAGVRARAAAQLAVRAGYKPEELGVYDGSWLDWEKRGGKVERWEGED